MDDLTNRKDGFLPTARQFPGGLASTKYALVLRKTCCISLCWHIFLICILVLISNPVQVFAKRHISVSLPKVLPHTMKLVWHDEFTGRRGVLANPRNWYPYVGGDGWGNDQLEYDTNDKNEYVNGQGQLVLEARKGNPAHYHCWYGSCQYTSARLSTKFGKIFTYGLIEARIKIPYGQGIWPAFWLLGSNITTGVTWPTCGEIDAMENIGSEPSTTHGTVHGPGYGYVGIGAPYKLSRGRFSDAYHIFAVQWDKVRIRFYVDGRNYFTVDHSTVAPYGSWVFDHPFFILLNVAVGGPWPGNPDSTTRFSQQMLVDYVRLYQ